MSPSPGQTSDSRFAAGSPLQKGAGTRRNPKANKIKSTKCKAEPLDGAHRVCRDRLAVESTTTTTIGGPKVPEFHNKLSTVHCSPHKTPNPPGPQIDLPQKHPRKSRNKESDRDKTPQRPNRPLRKSRSRSRSRDPRRRHVAQGTDRRPSSPSCHHPRPLVPGLFATTPPRQENAGQLLPSHSSPSHSSSPSSISPRGAIPFSSPGSSRKEEEEEKKRISPGHTPKTLNELLDAQQAPPDTWQAPFKTSPLRVGIVKCQLSGGASENALGEGLEARKRFGEGKGMPRGRGMGGVISEGHMADVEGSSNLDGLEHLLRGSVEASEKRAKVDPPVLGMALKGCVSQGSTASRCAEGVPAFGSWDTEAFRKSGVPETYTTQFEDVREKRLRNAEGVDEGMFLGFEDEDFDIRALDSSDNEGEEELDWFLEGTVDVLPSSTCAQKPKKGSTGSKLKGDCSAINSLNGGGLVKEKDQGAAEASRKKHQGAQKVPKGKSPPQRRRSNLSGLFRICRKLKLFIQGG